MLRRELLRLFLYQIRVEVNLVNLKGTLQGRDQEFRLCFGDNLRLVSPFTHQTEKIDDRLRAFQKDSALFL